MKRLLFLASLLVAGCAVSDPDADNASKPGAGPAPAAAKPGPTKEEQVAAIRTQIELKRNDLRKAEIRMGQIAARRFELEPQPASEAKSNEMAALAKTESEVKQEKLAIEGEIAELERKQSEISGAPKPKSADEALDQALAADAAREKEEADRRKAKLQADAAAEQQRLAEADKARQAELAAKTKEKVEGGRAAPAGADGSVFEERWADVILKVRAELQKYKRY